MPRKYNPARPPVAFPTPWRVKDTRVIDARGVHLVFESQGLGHSGPKILDRIAACANVMPEIPTEALHLVNLQEFPLHRLKALRTMIDGAIEKLALPPQQRGEG